MTNTAASEMEVDYAKVGWIFVQEYFSLKNSAPNQLHLFYNKNSKFSYGTEGEQAVNCFGQQEIYNQIDELDFQDCKVLISSVESLPSISRSILVQVLGEISNKGGPSHKFVESFVLAEQPSGYYVLNDIFRFLKEDIDTPFEDTQQPQHVAAVEQSHHHQQQHHQQQQAQPYHHVNGTNAINGGGYQSAPQPIQPPKQQQAPVPHSPKRGVDGVAQPQAVAPPSKDRARSPSPSKPEQKKAVAPMTPAASVAAPAAVVAPAAAPATFASPKKVETEKKSAWGNTPAPIGKPISSSWASEAPAAVVESAAPVTTAAPGRQQKAPAATPAPAAVVAPVPAVPASPPKPKTWASLAATNPKNWGDNVSGTPAAVENMISPQENSASVTPSASSVSRKKDLSTGPGKDERPQRQDFQSSGTAAKPQQSDEKDKYTVYVKGIHEDMTRAVLMDIFAPIGAVKSIDIVASKNIAFVEFVSIESAGKALGNYTVMGKTISAEERNRSRSRVPHHRKGGPAGAPASSGAAPSNGGGRGDGQARRGGRQGDGGRPASGAPGGSGAGGKPSATSQNQQTPKNK